jgi:hypothetical protein
VVRLAVIAIAFALGVAAAPSCSVDRRSGTLACSPTMSCTNGRTCVQGYCVLDPGDAHPLDTSPACPSQCASCDSLTMTCNITGGGAAVTCPPSWHCTIDCSATSSCPTVTCSGARSCTIDCAGSASCTNIACGSARCDVTCGGAGACNGVDCRSSCQCDVTCGGAGACGALQCPRLPGNQFCTTTGTSGSPCLSSFAAQCATC